MPSSSFNIFLPQGSCMWYVAIREYLIFFYTKVEEWSMEADRYSTMREIIKNTVSGYRQTSLWQLSDRKKKIKWKIPKFLKYLINAFNHGNDSVTFIYCILDVDLEWIWILHSQKSMYFHCSRFFQLSSAWTAMQLCSHNPRTRS